MYQRANQLRKGFTFVELLVGLVVTTIVVSALAAFTFAVSENWEKGDGAQSVFLAGTMAVERLTAIFRPAAAVLQSNPSACLLWAGDANGDSKIQLSETLQIRFDPSSQSVIVDRPFPATWTAAQVAQVDQTMSPASTMTAGAITNSAYEASSVLVRNVAACAFSVIPSADGIQLPSVEIVLTISSTNPAIAAQTIYSTVTMRAANLNPQ